MSLWTTQNAFNSFRRWFLPAGLRLPKTSLSSEQAVLFRYDRRLPEKRAYAGWLASAGFMVMFPYVFWGHWYITPERPTKKTSKSPAVLPDTEEREAPKLKPTWLRATASIASFTVFAGVALHLYAWQTRAVRRLFVLPTPGNPAPGTPARRQLFVQLFHHRGMSGILHPAEQATLVEGHGGVLGIRLKGSGETFRLGLDGASIGGTPQSEGNARKELVGVWDDSGAPSSVKRPRQSQQGPRWVQDSGPTAKLMQR